MMIYKKFLKPFSDIILTVLLLAFLSPLIIAIIIILSFVNKGSPIFLQTRAGYHGKPFRIIKFKTMNDNTDKEGVLLPDSKRFTRIGLLLRKTSLDELPQLFNVIKGDLSLVGPRPLLMQYLPHYTSEQAKRHEVKPGITGWAQIHGRQSLTFEKRFELDLWYVNNLSFMLDVRILLKTFINVLQSKDILHDEGAWRL